MQVAQLQAQIKALNTKAAQNQVSTVCVVLTHDFSEGATGATTNGEVSKLRQFLEDTGFFPVEKITGYFGPATLHALQAWQSADAASLGGKSVGSLDQQARVAMRASCY